MNFCPQCGEPRSSESARFCSSCGSPITSTTAVSTSAPLGTSSRESVSGTLDVDPAFYDLVATQHDSERHWRAAVGSVVGRFAEDWLGATVSTSTLLGLIDPGIHPHLAEEGHWMADASLYPGMVMFPFGQPTGSDMNPRDDDLVPLGSSVSGVRLLQTLARLGVNMAPLADDTALVGWWPTPGDGFAVQLASTYRTSAGREYLYWYTSPLISLLDGYAENEAAFVSLTVAIPALLQSTVYLAECPTPLSPAPLQLLGGRGPILFGVPTDSPQLPIPVARLALSDHPRGMNVYACTDEQGFTRTYFCNGRIDLGWAIPLDSPDHVLDRGIQVAVTGGLRISGILEEGLASTDSDSEFQSVLMSQSTTVAGSDQIWVPTSLTRLLVDLMEPCD